MKKTSLIFLIVISLAGSALVAADRDPGDGAENVRPDTPLPTVHVDPPVQRPTTLDIPPKQENPKTVQ